MTQPLPANTSGRRAILDRIQSRIVDAPALTEIDASDVVSFSEPLEKFSEMLGMVGGEAHVVESMREVVPILEQIDVFRSARRIVSSVPQAVESTMQVDAADDPHSLANVDWTVARGEFMVAENGSIWVDGGSLQHRVLLFIAQYLAIVVPRSEIVSNMHQAYQRIDDFRGPFGVFVSGPSKTADIEQSLVLGAHGCRRLQVFVVGDE